MAEQFNCPSCGVSLDYDGRGYSSMRCPFCNNTVVVPESLRIMHPTASPGAPPSPAARAPTLRPLRAQPPRRLRVGCGLAGLIALICTVTAIPASGPLNNLWSRVNPRGFARVTMTFGKAGTGPGFFSNHNLISVDPASGTIYVGDFDARRVQAFDPAGQFLTQWQVGESGTRGALYALAVNRSGVVYVIESAGFGGKIIRYDGATGKNLGPVVYLGQPDDFARLAMGADGRLVALTSDSRVVRFNSDGRVELTFRPPVGAGISQAIAVDRQGQIYFLSDNVVSRFSPEGEHLLSFGSRGSQPGMFLVAAAIAVDGQGRMYISDSKGIQVFDATGRYLDVITIQGYVGFNGLAFDGQNNLHAVTSKSQVTKFAIVK